MPDGDCTAGSIAIQDTQSIGLPGVVKRRPAQVNGLDKRAHPVRLGDACRQQQHHDQWKQQRQERERPGGARLRIETYRGRRKVRVVTEQDEKRDGSDHERFGTERLLEARDREQEDKKQQAQAPADQEIIEQRMHKVHARGCLWVGHCLSVFDAI